MTVLRRCRVSTVSGRPGLDTPVFLAVLAAALMHAGWHATVKIGLDRFSAILLMSMAEGSLALFLGAVDRHRGRADAGVRRVTRAQLAPGGDADGPPPARQMMWQMM
jgi:hypothetical protein